MENTVEIKLLTKTHMLTKQKFEKRLGGAHTNNSIMIASTYIILSTHFYSPLLLFNIGIIILPQSRYDYYLHFRDERAQAQRLLVTSLRSHRYYRKSWSRPKGFCFQTSAFIHVII